MKLLMNKIYSKIKNREAIRYLLWKIGYLKLSKFLKNKTINKEVIKWFKDDGDQKLRFNYELDSSSVIFELGAFKGSDLENYYKLFKSEIYAFEPSLKYYEILRDKFTESSINLYNFGLSDSNMKKILIESNDGSYLASKSKANEEFETVEMKKLSDFIIDENIKFIDLLNMNIEGSEYEVLIDLLNSEKISLINHLQIQYHRNRVFYRFKRYLINKKLRKTHNLIWCYKYVWERWDLK